MKHARKPPTGRAKAAVSVKTQGWMQGESQFDS